MTQARTQRVIPRPIHPFPARMAASIPWNELRKTSRKPLRVMDPMAGSGTTLVVARALGHEPIGFDRDPLAVLLAKVWCSNLAETQTRRAAEAVLETARSRARSLKLGDAYPAAADEETRAFARYWFDDTNRKQLTALADAIQEVRERSLREALWCAFSRMIITKQAGASRALDVAHSRPHRVDDKTTIRPLEHFLRAVETVIGAAPFRATGDHGPRATVKIADARNLPLDDSCIDVVVSSPPYLNAIDYVRGHKFSLVWMGHAIGALRQVRAGNIGTEVAERGEIAPSVVRALERTGDVQRLPIRQHAWLTRYVSDMDGAISELSRVLVPGGRAVLVIGDCTMRGVYVRNSSALASLAKHHGLRLAGRRTREIPPNRRYLPPPSSRESGTMLQNRMATEVLLDLVKT
jgi:DNA modification methylase